MGRFAIRNHAAQHVRGQIGLLVWGHGRRSSGNRSPSPQLLAAIGAALAAAVIIPLSPLGDVLGFTALPIAFWLLLVVIVATYLALVEMAKRRFEPRA